MIDRSGPASRHYYDIHMLMASDTGEKTLAKPTLGAIGAMTAMILGRAPNFEVVIESAADLEARLSSDNAAS